jgi:Rrf2 family iron-sulfur cluster assembly transcriptional regulator
MQITRAEEYAVIGLMYLARQPAGRLVMIEEICDAENIPKSFLAKIFQSLAKGGFVRSHRGAGGGFSLARLPSEISLLDIFRCVEGEFALQKCVSEEPECVVSKERLGSCTLCGIFTEAQNRVNEVFARTNLQDLITPRLAPLASAPLSSGSN